MPEMLDNIDVFCYIDGVTERANALPPLTTSPPLEGRQMAIPKLHSESESRKRLTAERLRHLLHYDPETGFFTRRTGRFSGDRAGSKCRRGYWMLRLDGARYYAHRLAFLYMTGEWPPLLVDHINRDPSDCRWENLRPADHSQNSTNRTYRKRRAASGARGVFQSGEGRWRARINIGSRKVHLGTFSTIEEARAAYIAAAQALRGEYEPSMLEIAA